MARFSRASIRINVDPNSISPIGSAGEGVVAFAPAPRRFMFVEHARARECGPEKSAVIPGFSRGRPGESVGTPRGGGTEEMAGEAAATSITLFLDRGGVAGGSAGLMHPFA